MCEDFPLPSSPPAQTPTEGSDALMVGQSNPQHTVPSTAASRKVAELGSTNMPTGCEGPTAIKNIKANILQDQINGTAS